MFIIITMMFREGQAHSPTKSDGDSADVKQTESSLKGKCGGAERRDSAVLGRAVRMGSNPSGSRPNFFGRQHLTFDKGGKCDSAGQRDSAVLGRVVRRDDS